MANLYAYLAILFSFTSYVHSTCRKGDTNTDTRFKSCQNVYRIEPDNNITRVLDMFAGKLTNVECIAHCGCNGQKYAGHDKVRDYCFCGQEANALCSTSTCVMVYETTGIPSSRTATIPSKVELFETVAVSITSATNVNKYAFVTNGKVALSAANQGKLGFSELGTDIKAVGEVEAYWGCRSAEVAVNVYSKVNMSLECKDGVTPGEKFQCFITIFEGSEITQLVWKKDGVPDGSPILHVAEPMHFAIGGEMKLDRFYSQKPNFDPAKGESPAFINLNWEFAATADLTAIEAHILRKGTIRILILRPYCDKKLGKRYCHSLKSCVASDYDCGKETVFESGEIEFYAPPGLPVFCASVERFMSDQDTACPGVGDVQKPLADYEVVYQRLFTVTEEGMVVLKIPIGERFTVYPGYLLGWMPGPKNPGDIAYYNLDPDDDAVYPVFRYDEVYTTYVGGIFSSNLPSAKTQRIFHMLSAHAFVPTRYMKEFTLNNLGQDAEISADIESKHSTVTRNKIVSVQDAINEFTFSVASAKTSSAEPVVFTITSVNAKLGVQYAYHFGETNFTGTFQKITALKTMSYTFNNEGSFNVTIKAFNKVSSVTKYTVVSVYVVVKQIGFINEIQPTNSKNYSSFAIFLEGGGACNLTYNFGDNTGDKFLSVSVSSYLVAEFKHSYKFKGDYVCRVTASNSISSKSVAKYSVVEDVITDLKIDKPPPIATNQSYKFSVTLKTGTNATHVWHWNDGTGNSTSAKNISTMSHVFSTYGNRTIFVYSYNLVSSFNTSMFVIVQNAIKGLRYEKREKAVILGDWCILYVYVDQGTGMNLQINFNVDSTLAKFRTAVAYNIDKGDGYFIAVGKYKYTAEGEYPFIVRAWNSISEANISGIVIVEKEITEFSAEFQHENKYIEVNETIEFIAKMETGTNAILQYDFGDNAGNYSTYSLKVLKRYLSWQIPFNVTLKAFNNVSTIIWNMSVPVQKPVEMITALKVWGGPGNVSEPVELKYSVKTGNDFTCNFTIEGIKKTIVGMYEDYRKGKMPTHKFDKPGKYKVTVNCRNRLYSGSAGTVITLYHKVSDFDIKPTFGEDCGIYKANDNGVKSSSDASDVDKWTFSLDCAINFQVIGQTGSNVTYSYQFNDGTKVVTSKNSTKHVFWKPTSKVKDKKPKSKSKVCSVKLTAQNPVHQITKNLEVTCVARVFNLTVVSDAPARVFKLVNFTISLVQSGYRSCLIINFGDNSDPYWVGGQGDCEGELPAKAKAKPDLQKHLSSGLVKISHTYTKIGKYKSVVIGVNRVNREVVTTTIDILDKPCDYPKLSWPDPTTAKKPRKVMKSEKFTFVPKIKINCERTNRVAHQWRIFKVDTRKKKKKEQEILNAVPTTINDTVLKIGIRSLDYGLYRININASMWMVEGISSAINGYVSIVPSPLNVKFVGGSGRAVGQGTIGKIDASLSGDPDEDPKEKTGLILRWYCKQETETFGDLSSLPDIDYPSSIHIAAANISINATASGFRGCFGNGVGHLSAFDDQLEISVNTSYMPIRLTYTIRLELRKNSTLKRIPASGFYSLSVVPGRPPQVVIRCKLNCKAKVNSCNKLSLLADCPKCTSKILYSWTVFRSLADEAKFEELSDAETKAILSTPRDSSNLVIPSGKLDAKYEYKVKIEGFISPDLREYGGFSLYLIKINTPPIFRLKSIRVVLTAGNTVPEPLKKIFRADARGFVDEDGPLTYKCLFRAGNSNSTDWVTFYSGLSYVSETFLVPPPEEGADGTIKIQCVAVDSLGGFSEPQYTSIKVRQKEINTEELFDVLSNDYDLIDSSMKVGVVLSSMNKEESSGEDNKLLTKCVDLLVSQPLTTPDNALVLARSIKSVVSNDGLATSAKKSSLDAASRISEFVTADVSPDTIEDLTRATIGLTMAVSGEVGDKKLQNEMVLSADKVKKKLGLATAGNKVPGEPPTEITSKESALAFQSVGAGGSGNKLAPTGQKGGFGLPTEATGNGSSTPVATEVGENKYASFSSGSSPVSSPLYGCIVGGAGFGEAKKVAALSEPIEVEIDSNGKPIPGTYLVYSKTITIGHSIALPYNLSTIQFMIKPVVNESSLLLLVSKGERPTLTAHRWNYTVPRELDHSINGTNETADAHEDERWTIFMDAKTLNYTAKGVYYFTVLRYCNNSDDTDATEDKISCPPINITMWFREHTCLFFDEETKEFSTEGCQVSEKTNENATVCLCSHLTSFGGGGVFAAPNPIDFSKALAGFGNLAENPVVFSVVMTIIGLYFILMAWCRRMDKRDIDKIGVCPLPDNHPSDNYFYEIAVQTGFANGCTSTADVFIVLVGTTGESAPRQLKNPNRKCFHKGDTDQFLLATPYSLGMLKGIEIWHNNSGSSPGWFCLQVQIRDAQTDKKWVFVCNRWLDVAEEDGLIKRKIEVSGKHELTQFDFLFAQTARKNLYDGHIWFSIVTRPPRSTFTRCQRLACCFSLLLTTMLSNAMFYQGGDPPPGQEAPPPENALHLGPITISVDQIRIGITSSLVVIPVNVIIVALFQKAGPRTEKSGKYKKGEGVEGEEEDDGDTTSQETSQYGKASTANFSTIEIEEGNAASEKEEPPPKVNKLKYLQLICIPGKEEDEDEEGGQDKKKGKKKAKKLPHWVIYISYFLVFVSSSTSAFFVCLYGFQFGKKKSEEWISSMMISFWQSVLVIQPVKVIALSVFFALIIKDPSKAQDEEQETRRKEIGEDEELQEENWEDDGPKQPRTEFKLPDEKKLEEARQKRLQEKKMKAIIREIVVHLMFLMLCLFVGYSNLDSFSFNLGYLVKKLASEGGLTISYKGEDANVPAESIGTRGDYWKWVDNTLVPFLFPDGWYNGDQTYTAGFVADAEPSKVLALARFRQLRVRPDTCTKHPVFQNIISQCIGAYSWLNEEKEEYSDGWKPPYNKTVLRRNRKGRRKAYWMGMEMPWKYQSVIALKNFPFLGKFATYGGSSYAVSIGPDQRIAKLIVDNLKKHYWIDRYTRAIFTEANIYNANTNLMLIVTFLTEILPTGGYSYFENIQSLRLFRYNGGFGGVVLIVDLIYIIVTIINLYKTVKGCRKESLRGYLSDAWHALHFLVTVFSVCTIVTIFARVGAVMWATKQYKADPEVFVSFAYVGLLEYFVMAFIGFVVFFTNLEFLRLLRFNRRIGLLTATMRASAKPLMSFGVMFMFLFFAYVSMGHLLWGGQIEDFRNILNSFIAMMKMFLGQFDLHEYSKHSPLLGPILFFSYMVLVQMILINVFIGIVCETFEDVRSDAEKQPNEHEILSFMTNRLKKITGSTGDPTLRPIYREWKKDWQVTLEEIEEKTDNVTYLLSDMEAQEVRQSKWFDPEKADKRRRLMLTLLVGSEEFLYDNEICDAIPVIEKKFKGMNKQKIETLTVNYARKKKQQKEMPEQRQSNMDNLDIRKFYDESSSEYETVTGSSDEETEDEGTQQ